MCPHGYHHSGSMATPALGTRDIYIYIFDSSKTYRTEEPRARNPKKVPGRKHVIKASNTHNIYIHKIHDTTIKQTLLVS